MADVIKVIEAWQLKSYDSMSEAVTAAKLRIESEQSLDLINGAIVEDYRFYGDCLVFKFENGEYLNIKPGLESLQWYVLAFPENRPSSYPPEDLTLSFSDGEEVEWGWKTILDGFIGKQTAVSPSDQCLFIFNRGGPEYMISVLLEAENPDKQMLFISES